MTQSRYTRALLSKHGYEHTKGAVTPNMDDDGPADDEVVDAERAELVKQCQEQVGGLLWLRTNTRGELAYAVSRPAALMTSKPRSALKRCKTICRFVASIVEHGLGYSAFNENSYMRRTSCAIVTKRLSQLEEEPDDESDERNLLL